MSDHFDRFGSDSRYQHRDHDHGYDHDIDSHHGHGHYLMYFELARRIFKNKTLLTLALIVLFISLMTVIWLVSLLVPLLGQLLSIAEKHGIKGAIEAISPYLLKLWEGAVKS
jgi:hypothetical protein